jgi:hypothetical protein
VINSSTKKESSKPLNAPSQSLTDDFSLLFPSFTPTFIPVFQTKVEDEKSRESVEFFFSCEELDSFPKKFF